MNCLIKFSLDCYIYLGFSRTVFVVHLGVKTVLFCIILLIHFNDFVLSKYVVCKLPFKCILLVLFFYGSDI